MRLVFCIIIENLILNPIHITMATSNVVMVLLQRWCGQDWYSDHN